MIFVIAPLGERESHLAHGARVSVFCMGTLLSGAMLGAGVGTLAGIAGVHGLRLPLWLWACILTLLVLRELGVVPVPLPYRDWQMPRDWLRYGNLQSAMLFGLTMGAGVLTRAPIGAFHGTLLLDVMLSSTGYGLIIGSFFAVGRSLPVAATAALKRSSAADLVNVSNFIVNGMQLWRLLGIVALSALVGLVLAAWVTAGS